MTLSCHNGDTKTTKPRLRLHSSHVPEASTRYTKNTQSELHRISFSTLSIDVIRKERGRARDDACKQNQTGKKKKKRKFESDLCVCELGFIIRTLKPNFRTLLSVPATFTLLIYPCVHTHRHTRVRRRGLRPIQLPKQFKVCGLKRKKKKEKGWASIRVGRLQRRQIAPTEGLYGTKRKATKSRGVKV